MIRFVKYELIWWIRAHAFALIGLLFFLLSGLFCGILLIRPMEDIAPLMQSFTESTTIGFFLLGLLCTALICAIHIFGGSIPWLLVLSPIICVFIGMYWGHRMALCMALYGPQGLFGMLLCLLPCALLGAISITCAGALALHQAMRRDVLEKSQYLACQLILFALGVLGLLWQGGLFGIFFR